MMREKKIAKQMQNKLLNIAEKCLKLQNCRNAKKWPKNYHFPKNCQYISAAYFWKDS